MELNDVIKLAEKEISEMRNVDCHINDFDDASTVRQKDMAFGKVKGAEKILEIIKNAYQ